jgi:hypothetical protein
MLLRRERNPGIAPHASLADRQHRNIRTTDARHYDKVRRRQQLHRSSERIGDIRVIQICQQNNQAAAFQQATNTYRGGRRIAFGRLDTQTLERTPDSGDCTQTSSRRALHEGAVRKHHQTDTIIIRCRNFGETCRRVGVVPQPVERTGPYPTEATSIDRDENIEMPILTELPCHELTCARGRLPVNSRQRITIPVTTQLV